MSDNTHLENNSHPITSSSSLTRRQFLKRLGILGGGVVVYFTGGRDILSARTRRQGFLGANIPTDFNAFLRIGTDERVTCFTGKIEMGQGPITSLPQMLAEDLDVSYDVVDIVMGDTDLCPWDAGTWGSLTTRYFGVFLREAASEAKGVLKELAAEHLKCPMDRVLTKNGVLFDQSRPSHRVTYGQLTKGKIIEKHLKELPPLKSVSEFSVMGKSYLRQDARDKVTGKAQYAGDFRLPGMVYAKILRPPAHGARLKNVDVSPAKEIKGAEIVRQDDFIAVLHDQPDQAEEAVARMKAQFDLPETGVDDKTIFDDLLRKAPSPYVVAENGSIDSGRKKAAILIEETYLNSYVAHAPIEPHTAVAQFKDNRITVWASTQAPFSVQRTIAGVLNMSMERVRVITPFVGGGFGGKSASQQAVEAARLAKMTGRPVQVAWSREEEFFYDSFRPAAIVKIASGLDNRGNIVFWDYHVYYAGRRGAELFYDVPHHRELMYGDWLRMQRGIHPFAVGPWRAPANNTNTYARELHLNLMASKAGLDPLEFRLRHLKDKRMIGVLKAAAKKFGWTSAKTPSGRGVGIACSIDAGTYVATMAEVDVDGDNGTVEAKRVVCAQDMGIVVNPQGATIQMEGCITMGLGYALTEEIRFRNGELFDTNFDSYTIPKFSWLPEIETVIVENDQVPPQGGGEPAIVNMGGVIATAIHDATGAKLLQLPMTPERVQAALESNKG